MTPGKKKKTHNPSPASKRTKMAWLVPGRFSVGFEGNGSMAGKPTSNVKNRRYYRVSLFEEVNLIEAIEGVENMIN